MGYFLISEAETAVSAQSLASPKTHTPWPRLQERGHRYYSAELSRWVSRDPIGESGGLSLYTYLLNSPLNDTDYLGLMEGSVHVYGPREVVDHRSDTLYGGVWPSLLENSCQCACSKKKGRFELSCKLDIGYYISIATQDSSVWEDAPPSFPSYPTPPDWDSLSYREKKAHVLGHERRHVQAYKDWHTRRKVRIEAFEQLVYPSKSACDQRGGILVEENSAGYAAQRRAQRSHEGW
jgi:RHS repeat-associated protein